MTKVPSRISIFEHFVVISPTDVNLDLQNLNIFCKKNNQVLHLENFFQKFFVQKNSTPEKFWKIFFGVKTRSFFSQKMKSLKLHKWEVSERVTFPDTNFPKLHKCRRCKRKKIRVREFSKLCQMQPTLVSSNICKFHGLTPPNFFDI